MSYYNSVLFTTTDLNQEEFFILKVVNLLSPPPLKFLFHSQSSANMGTKGLFKATTLFDGLGGHTKKQDSNLFDDKEPNAT